MGCRNFKVGKSISTNGNGSSGLGVNDGGVLAVSSHTPSGGRLSGNSGKYGSRFGSDMIDGTRS
eukprot:15340447-Ditylum_brightwellii.AAC.1